MSKFIELDQNFSLEADRYAWNLHYRSEGEINEETGKPIITQWVHYHGDIQFALKDYMNASLKPAADVVELLQRIDLAENRILALALTSKSK